MRELLLRFLLFSTGNTQYKVSNPTGCSAFNTSLGQRLRLWTLTRALRLWTPGKRGSPFAFLRRRCCPAPDPEGIPLYSRTYERTAQIRNGQSFACVTSKATSLFLCDVVFDVGHSPSMKSMAASKSSSVIGADSLSSRGVVTGIFAPAWSASRIVFLTALHMALRVSVGSSLSAM